MFCFKRGMVDQSAMVVHYDFILMQFMGVLYSKVRKEFPLDELL